MRRALVGTAAVVALALATLVAPASASAPMQATGTQTYRLVPTCDPAATCKTADGNLFLTVANTGTRTGTFTGSQLFVGTITVFPSGDFVYHGRTTFEGTVAGCGTGTVIFNAEGSGNIATGPTRDRFWATGQGTLRVQANITQSASIPNSDGSFTAEYTGTYHC